MSHHFRKPHSEVLNFLMSIALKCFVTATLATLVTLVTYLQVSVGASNAGTPAVQVDWCERHAPNVLKQKLSTYLAMQIPSLKLPSASDKFQFTYEVKMPFACGCLRWHNQGGLQQCRYRLCSKRSLQLVRDIKRHKMCFQASDLNE